MVELMWRQLPRCALRLDNWSLSLGSAKASLVMRKAFIYESKGKIFNLQSNGCDNKKKKTVSQFKQHACNSSERDTVMSSPASHPALTGCLEGSQLPRR